MSILNVNTIQPVGSGQTITVSATNITASSAALTVGSITNTSGSTVVAAGSASAPSISPTGDSNTGIFFPSADTIAFAEGGVEAARFDSSGRLGIGTNISLADILTVNDTNPKISMRASGTERAFLQVDSSTDFIVNNKSISNLIFKTSDTERSRITNAGYFKATTGSYVNSSGNYHELVQSDANTTAYFAHTSSTAANCYGINISYRNADPNGTGNQFIYCEGNGSIQRMSVRSNGGISNYQANDVNLSDINAKKDITPAADTWDCVKEWEIVNYRYKDQSDESDLNLGVIAQQVAEYCPEVITVFEEAKDNQPEKLGVKEQQMYWMAIKALQEAQERIEQLEARLNAAGL